MSKVAEAHASVDKTMRIKRLGPDLDDNYWMFGKIHGLENIAYLTDEEVAACNGNPVALQEAINNVKIPKGVPQTYEERIAKLKINLDKYKKAVD